jgi:hypothetical protein
MAIHANTSKVVKAARVYWVPFDHLLIRRLVRTAWPLSRKRRATDYRPGPSLVSELGDQSIARHDFRNPFGELEDIVPQPVCGDLIGGECFIRDIKHSDADGHVWSAIEQVVAPKTW